MRRLLPVIHILDEDQVLEQVDVALEGGADGVWLIDHEGMSDEFMWELALYRVRPRHPDLWIGLNFLSMNAAEAMASVVDDRIDGLWTDDAKVRPETDSRLAKRIWEAKKRSRWRGTYFGGVAFKGSKPVRDPAAAARAAKDLMDVVTTSGPATGVPAELDKIRAMKEAVGDHRLAVASGITPENAPTYLPYVDDFLVATGISRDFHTLDGPKVRALADIVHDGVEQA